MPALLVQCPKCSAPLDDGLLNKPGLEPCPRCQSLLQVEIFPALFRRSDPLDGGELVLIEGDSTCFYHAGRKALRPCQGCGRFLCALCDCQLNGENFCPRCLETGKTKGKIKNLETRRTRYDRIAFSLAVIPLLLYPFTLITAPIALFIAIRYRKEPPSILHRSRIRLVAAIILASLQIVGWGIVIYLLIWNMYLIYGRSY